MGDVMFESFDSIHKARRRAEGLPVERQRASELGQWLAGAETIAAWWCESAAPAKT